MRLPLLLIALIPAASAETALRYGGVLGNSGEQGATLVRFAGKSASGMGVAYDAQGSLWDRGGDGRLNRYAVDGRLLASYEIPAGGGAHDKDTLVICGDQLLMKVGKSLHVLPLDAPPGTRPTVLAPELTRISPNSQDGWVAAAKGREAFLVNAAGETKPVAVLEADISDIAIGPDNGIFAKTGDTMQRIDLLAPGGQRGPWPAPGDRPQWLAERWYGSAWHGTLRRFGADFLPDPGVVLGGASGAFIGYVPGNHEMNDSRGLADLGGNLFAASGAEGVMHLLEWSPVESRFTLLRRIGAVPLCGALAMDGEDRIWFHSGFWEWSDGPDTPLRHSVPPPDSPGFAGAVTLPGGGIVAPGIRWKKPALYYGKGDGPAGLSEGIPLPENAVACALVPGQERLTLLVTDAQGKGRLMHIASEGKFEGDAGAAELPGGLPAITSLATQGKAILAADKGEVIGFRTGQGGFKETSRWKNWGSKDAASRFGEAIHIAASEDMLWVADTLRHRVLCFDAAGKLLASFGTADRAGENLTLLNRPTTVAARGKRAVVFDSGNQRLVKLEFSGE